MVKGKGWRSQFLKKFHCLNGINIIINRLCISIILYCCAVPIPSEKRPLRNERIPVISTGHSVHMMIMVPKDDLHI